MECEARGSPLTFKGRGLPFLFLATTNARTHAGLQRTMD